MKNSAEIALIESEEEKKQDEQKKRRSKHRSRVMTVTLIIRAFISAVVSFLLNFFNSFSVMYLKISYEVLLLFSDPIYFLLLYIYVFLNPISLFLNFFLIPLSLKTTLSLPPFFFSPFLFSPFLLSPFALFLSSYFQTPSFFPFLFLHQLYNSSSIKHNLIPRECTLKSD